MRHVREQLPEGLTDQYYYEEFKRHRIEIYEVQAAFTFSCSGPKVTHMLLLIALATRLAHIWQCSMHH